MKCTADAVAIEMADAGDGSVYLDFCMKKRTIEIAVKIQLAAQAAEWRIG